jgi:uncharacterized RDD family membrane protein YckC
MSDENLKTQVLGAAPSYGGFWIRFLAYIVDSLLIIVACAAISAGAAFAGDIGALVSLLVFLAGPFVYFAALQSSPRQASLGKALVGLKVTGVDGGRIGFLRALGREAAKLISAFALMIGFLLAAFTQRKQALHDMVASTLVVRDSPGHVVAALALAVAAIVAPFALLTVVGAGAMSQMLGPMAAVMIEQQPPPPPARRAAPPKPAPAAKPAATKPAAPAPVAKPPAPAVAVVKEPAKPLDLPKPVVVARRDPVAAPSAPKAPPAKAPPAAKTALAPVMAAPAPPPPPVAAAAVPVRAGPAIPGPRHADLMTAVMYRDPAGVEELIAFGKWPDKPDSRGLTPLAVAVMLGDRASAEALLKGGADPGTASRVMEGLDDPAMRELLARYRRK